MGKIIVADDQAINVDALKNSLDELNYLYISEFYLDGQSVIDRVKEIVEQAI